MKGLKNPWVVSAITHAKALHANGDHKGEVAYLEVVVRDSATPEDRRALQSWLGYGLLTCTGRVVDALALYTQLVREYEPHSVKWIRSRSYVATAYSRLGAHGLAVEILEEAYRIGKGLRKKLPDFDILVVNLVREQLNLTRDTYPVGRPGIDHRICNRCVRVVKQWLACDCGRAWYCGEICRYADREAHIHPHFPMDRLPADLIRHHIVPLCLASRSSDPFSGEMSRRRGLGLRTLNRTWRACVDACHDWWFDVVAQSWRREFRPFKRPTATAEVLPMVLKQAKKQWRDVLKRRKKAMESKIRLLDKKRESRNAKIEGIKREIDDIDIEQQTEREGLEALQKKLKQ